jgi:molybdopterin-containing oxidoreductase family molybdopterin binding subunit
VRQPVVAPDGEQRYFADVLLDLADRAGFREDLNAALNASLDLQPPYRLRPSERVPYAEVCDRDLKDKFGDDKGLDWFREHGVLKWKKKPEEVYWRHFEEVRVPLYWEWLPALGEQIAAIAEPRGVPIRREFFAPLPDHIACTSHVDHAPGFDLTAFYYRDSVHTNSFTLENPWLDEAARLDPYSYTVALNAATCARLGLEDGQAVRIETEHGKAIDGRLRAMQGIHPDGVGIAACAGHWGDGMPIAKGKGMFFNQLLEIDMRYINPVNLGLDVCVQVRVVGIDEEALRGIVS